MPARTTTFDFFCVATSHPKDPPPTLPSPTLTTPQNFLQSKQIHSQPNPMQSTGLISTNAKNTKAKPKVKAKSVRENRSKQRERKTRVESVVKGKPHKMPLKNFPNLEVELRLAGVPTETAKRRQSQSWIEKKTHRECWKKFDMPARLDDDGVVWGDNTVCLSAFQLLLLNICWGLLICLPV